MREILFRGKRTDNGEWIEGRLLADDVIVPKGQEFYNPNNFLDSSIYAYTVISETVGQYTGLTDKNGKKIFEGDIVRTKKYGKVIGHVNVNDYDTFCVVYEPAIFRVVNITRGFNLVGRDIDYEVIGNIHDNPELLKK